MSSPSRWALARRLGRAIAAGLVASAVLSPGTALGHAILERSNPPDGSSLSSPPTEIRLTFTEVVEPELSRFELVAGDQARIDLEVPLVAPGDPFTIVLAVPRLPPDAYRVRWRVVSDRDLHGSVGSLVFGVGAAAPAREAPTDAPAPPIDALLRWLELIGLAVLVGGLAVRRFALPGISAGTDPAAAGDPLPRAMDRLRRLALRGLILAALASWGRFMIEVADVGQGTIPGMVGVIGATEFGILWAIQEIGLLASLAVLLGSRRSEGDRRTTQIALLGSLSLALFAHAAAGHIAALAGLAGALVGTAHLAAACVWVGGLAALVAAAGPLIRLGDGGRTLARSSMRRFARLALPSAAVLALSGAYAAGETVATPDAILLSGYGHLLVAKVALVGVVAFIGLVNAAALHRTLRRTIGPLVRRLAGIVGGRRVPRGVRIERSAALALLAITGLLGTTAPARGPAFDPPQVRPVIAPVAQPVDDLLVTLDVRPNHPGRNVVSIGAFDTRRPAPAPIDEVEVTMTAPDGRIVRAVAPSAGDGRYELVSDDLDADGPWRFVVSVRRTGFSDARLAAPWIVLAAAPGRPPTVLSTASLAEILRPALISGSLAALLIGLLLWRGRRPRLPADGTGVPSAALHLRESTR